VRYMQYSISGRDNFLVEDPTWAEEFAPNGALLSQGDTIYRKRYAETLVQIANYGSPAFYTGHIAESMIATIRQSNGSMTLSDLADYKIAVRAPLSATFRGYKLHTTGAPASGAVLLGILKAMEQYPLEDFADVNLTTHRFDEAMRFAYGARLELGDPDFVEGVQSTEEMLVSDEAARAIRKKINDRKTQPVEVYDPRMVYLPENHGTSHVVTADKDGMATSLTTTINLLFGARIKDPVSGVILYVEPPFAIPLATTFAALFPAGSTC
jgi:gamma-glutamyltranspeptidase / glutathione hydrolase